MENITVTEIVVILYAYLHLMAGLVYIYGSKKTYDRLLEIVEPDNAKQVFLANLLTAGGLFVSVAIAAVVAGYTFLPNITELIGEGNMLWLVLVSTIVSMLTTMPTLFIYAICFGKFSISMTDKTCLHAMWPHFSAAVFLIWGVVVLLGGFALQ